MLKPLEGLKVLELARILAGPWAGQTLADLGAEVIKVERPGGGDDTRQWGPPFVAGADGGRRDSAYYYSCNRGKSSVAVDFERPEGRDLVRRFAARADVLIENFKTGGLAKYGLDYEGLRAINPRLVYCSITGFGQTGPYAKRAGYDFMIQGMGGIMDLTGDPDGEPQKPGSRLCGHHLRPLFGRGDRGGPCAARRHRRGRLYRHGAAGRSGRRARQPGAELPRLRRGPRRLGNAHPNLVPYQVFQVADGHSSSRPAMTARRATSAACSASRRSPTIRGLRKRRPHRNRAVFIGLLERDRKDLHRGRASGGAGGSSGACRADQFGR